jgi:Cft2 family RNA processing exonuclease
VTLTNLTRATEIGANSYLLEADGRRLLLDCGLHPRIEGRNATPRLEDLAGKPLDGIIITHAHLDHLGSLPLALRDRTCRAFLTPPTFTLADPLLHNSAQVMKKRAEDRRDPSSVLFTHHDVNRAMKNWHAVPFGVRFNLESRSADEGELAFEFMDAGHVMGAAAVRVRHGGRTLLYTGDVNFADQTITPAARLPREHVDTLIMETTRGAHATPSGFTRDAELKRLAAGITETFARGGTVLMPVFALGKTQEALAFLHGMMESGAIPPATIFISGMGWKLTELHDSLAPSVRRHVPHLRLLDKVRPQLFTGRHLVNLRLRSGQIYLLTSGMMNEKTSSNMVGQLIVKHERHSVFFIGYTDPESPAGRLRAAVREGKAAILDQTNGEQDVRCQVDHFDLTAHALREDLLEYALALQPSHTVLVHGDPNALEWFRAQLADRAPDMRVTLPPPGVPIDV